MRAYGLQCPNCGYRIFSRAHHDWHTCACGGLYIDGGFDYCHAGGKFLNGMKRAVFELGPKVTREILYQDWNSRINKFGKVPPRNPKKFPWDGVTRYNV